MALEIAHEGENSTFETILKDENDAVISQANLTGLTLTFKNKRSAGGKGIRVGVGGTNYIDAGSDASLKIIGDITIEARIKLEDPLFPNYNINNEIFNNEAANDGFTFRIDSAAGQLLYRTKQAGGANQISRTLKTLTKDKWYHIAVTRSGASATFYIDGEAASKDLNGSHVDPVASTTSHKLLTALDGFADFVRVYNRVLTADEIKSRYQYNFDIQIGLVSDWQFQGSAKDSKGPNHGTPFGTETLKNFGIINGRYAQDVRGSGPGTNQHTIGALDGKLTWNMQTADNPILNPFLAKGDIEEHIAEYIWTASGKTGKHVISMYARKALI